MWPVSVIHDICGPQYRKIDTYAISIAISPNRYKHYFCCWTKNSNNDNDSNISIWLVQVAHKTRVCMTLTTDEIFSSSVVHFEFWTNFFSIVILMFEIICIFPVFE